MTKVLVSGETGLVLFPHLRIKTIFSIMGDACLLGGGLRPRRALTEGLPPLQVPLEDSHEKIPLLLFTALFVSALSACGSSKKPEPTATSTPSLIPTIASTQTSTRVSTFTLSGTIFFDYNGNGMQDGEELGISGANIQIGKLDAITDDNGNYTLQDVPTGTHRVQLSASSFRYISLSLEDFKTSDKPVSITIDSDTQRDWGLMEGFLTIPFLCNTQNSIGSWYDLENAVGIVRNWERNTRIISGPVANGGTLDQHDGIDYLAEKGITIVSSAPGKVTFVGQSQPPPGFSPALVVEVTHIDGYVTHYGHVDKQLVSMGQSVQRGQPIAEVGSTGSSMVHLHWSLRSTLVEVPHNPLIYPEKSNNFDPYRDLLNSGTISYWTVDNNPQCLP